MKKILLILFVSLSIYSIQAQPQGGRPSMGGVPPQDMNGDRRPSDRSNEKPSIERFPEIPDLTLDQRMKVGSVLSKEMQNICDQVDKKRQIEKSIQEETSGEKREKLQEKLGKSDKKIQSIRDKSNKKIKRTLTEEQYFVFIEKRADFKFRQPPKNKPMDDRKMRPPFDRDEQSMSVD